MARLQGKVALITGAGGGIGQAGALLFAREGAKVVVCDIAEPAGQETVRQIEAAGGQGLFVQTDVGEPEQMQAAVKAAVAAFGKLDVLYNNAGGTNPKDGPVTEAEPEIFWATMRRDLFGTWLGCKYGIPELIKAGGGSVICTASQVALMGKPPRNNDAYTAAKGGIVSMVRSMAVTYAPHKVRVNAIAPAMTMTDRLKRRVADGFVSPVIVARHLLGPGEPIDVANAALFFASDESRMITGHTLPVDSGIVMS